MQLPSLNLPKNSPLIPLMENLVTEAKNLSRTENIISPNKVDRFMTLTFDQGNSHNYASDLQANSNLSNRLKSLQKHLADTYEATIQSLIYALELHDGESRAHATRVAELTILLAREFGIPEQDLPYIRYGALLHDVGKIGVPGRILKKRGALTKKEWGIVKKHPTYAYELLSSFEFLKPALDIPYYHHERWDGSGYPHGLHGEQIPVAARIFSVVDVWDALRSNRPYRPATWSDDQILTYIQQHSGRYFEPQVVDAFLHLQRKIRLQLVPLPC